METQKTNNLEDRVDVDSKGFLKELFLNFIPGYTTYDACKHPPQSRFYKWKESIRDSLLVEANKIGMYAALGLMAAKEYFSYFS